MKPNQNFLRDEVRTYFTDQDLGDQDLGNSGTEHSGGVAVESPRPAQERDACADDAPRLYRALENLIGDVYLMGLCEITLEDIYAGSAHDAMRVLKQLQRWRERDTQLAIGQAARKPE